MAVTKLSLACLNWWTALFFVSFVNLWTHDASGILIVKPRNALVLAGQVVTLNCSTSLAEDVHWYYGTTYIYAGKKLYQPYKENYKVEVFNKSDGTTTYSLVFLSIKREDAGTYNCRENQGRGALSSAEMTVFTADGNGTCQSNIKPDGVVIPNDCNIDPDELQLSCSITFNGKNPPQLEWTKVPDNGDSVAKTECQTANNRVKCNASVTGDKQMNHSSYVCQTTGSSELNIKLCTIEVKNLIYAFSTTTPTKSTVGHEVQCSSDTSQTCQYKWKHSDAVVSISRSITPVNTGLYQCEADCNIRGKRCIVFDYAYISLNQSNDSTSCSAGCVFAILFGISLAIVLIFIVIYRFCSRKENGKMSQSPDEYPKKMGLEARSQEIERQEEQTGLIERHKRMETKSHSNIVVDDPNLIQTLLPEASMKADKAVFGIAILNNELFVLIMGLPEMEVFHLGNEKLEFSTVYSLMDYQLEIPWDIQSCSKSCCLYIVNKKKNEAHAEIIRADSKGNVQTSWSTGCEACRISIANDSNVIVTSLYQCTITEYSSDGTRIRMIELPSDAGSPWVTLKRNKDEYIMSYGNRGDSQHGVYVIGQNEEIKQYFGGNKGSNIDQLCVPVHMAAFSNGHILVADKDNSRTVLLSPELKLIKVLFSQSKKLRFPNRICLDEQNKRLFVSDNKWISDMKPWNNGRVLVFDMSSMQTTLDSAAKT